MTDYEGTGLVQLHTWGPNKKTKEVTVQINKSKGGEFRLVTKKVVKPLLDKFLEGETVKSILQTFFKDVETLPVQGEDNMFTCPTCSKPYKTERTMKTHITRMHEKVQCKQEDNAAKLNGTIDSELDQSVLKCEKCDFKTVNKTKMKKHKKKPHVVSSPLNSPVKKKARVSVEVSKAILEDMLEKMYDTHETDAETDKELIKHEKASFEENIIDDQQMDATLEKKRLSDQQDKKILDRKRKEEEIEEAIAPEKHVKEAIKRKKKSNTGPIKKSHIALPTKLPAGFKEIPENLKRHFPKDHVILMVDANGLCGVS